MDKNTYMIIDQETNRILASYLPKSEALTLLGLLCQYAPEIRGYSIIQDYFDEVVDIDRWQDRLGKLQEDRL